MKLKIIIDANTGMKSFYFGMYPQSLKTDDVKIISKTQNRYGYYKGSDGYYYAKIKAYPSIRKAYFSNKNEIIAGKTYYFKVEPIKWNIIEDNTMKNQTTSFIAISANVIDNVNRYYGHMTVNILREWMNSYMKKRIFSEYVQNYLRPISGGTPKCISSACYVSFPDEFILYANDDCFNKMTITITDYAMCIGATLSLSTNNFNTTKNGNYGLVKCFNSLGNIVPIINVTDDKIITIKDSQEISKQIDDMEQRILKLEKKVVASSRKENLYE